MWDRDSSNVFCHLNYWLCLLKRNENITKKAVMQIFVRTQSREAVLQGGFVFMSCAGRTTVSCCMFPLILSH